MCSPGDSSFTVENVYWSPDRSGWEKALNRALLEFKRTGMRTRVFALRRRDASILGWGVKYIREKTNA